MWACYDSKSVQMMCFPVFSKLDYLRRTDHYCLSTLVRKMASKWGILSQNVIKYHPSICLCTSLNPYVVSPLFHILTYAAHFYLFSGAELEIRLMQYILFPTILYP